MNGKYWGDIRGEVCHLEVNRCYIKYVCEEHYEEMEIELSDECVENICSKIEMLVDKGKYLVFSRQGEMLANCHRCIERCLALLHRRRCRV
jgi:hypothetical protein